MHVFAYGSLMWNPGFRHRSAVPALAVGWERRWCVRSTDHRGTRDVPGIVLGLVPGGSCVGLAYEVDSEDAQAVLSYLDGREMCEDGYERSIIEVEVPGRAVLAVCYVCTRYSDMQDEAVRLAIARASGRSGTNAEYAARTLDAIRSIRSPAAWPLPCPGKPLTAGGTCPLTSRAAA